MSRLTQRLDLGLDDWEQIAYEVPRDKEGMYNIVDLVSYAKEKEIGDILIQITEKLAEYEDLGLTPQQLMEVDKLYLEKCEEVNKLKEIRTPKKPTWVLHQGKGNNYQKCPNCDKKWLYLNQDYCEWCGQAIDWSEEV